ncbi:MAG: transglutaminase domain-containing protein [Candidatus Heimdallarchaeota archaeon]|nr:transglutaminase domain-containing protein [Candidatus Heimdallarchaeota archaeon]
MSTDSGYKTTFVVKGKTCQYILEYIVDIPLNHSLEGSRKISFPAEKVEMWVNDQKINTGFNSRNTMTEIQFIIPHTVVERENHVKLVLSVHTKYLPKNQSILHIETLPQLDQIISDTPVFSISYPSKIRGSYNYHIYSSLMDKLKEKRHPIIEFGKKINYTLLQQTKVKTIGSLSSLEVTMRMPKAVSYQKISNYYIFPKGGDIRTNMENNLEVTWKYENIGPSSIEFSIITEMIRKPGIMEKKKYGKTTDYPKTYAITNILEDDHRWNIPIPPQLKSLLKETDIYTIISKVFFYVKNTIEYTIIDGTRDASYALKYKKGDCSEISDLTVALLRDFGVPARIAIGYTVDRNNPGKNLHNVAGHAWVEVLMPSGHWYPFDPTWGYLGGITSTHILEAHDSGEYKVINQASSIATTYKEGQKVDLRRSYESRLIGDFDRSQLEKVEMN